MAIIETKGLTYTYQNRAKPSIKDVSVSIEKGEFVLITGPSGCGKTTLCRCFNGLIPHFHKGELKGEVVVAGLKVTEHPVHKLATHVGFVFQNPENQLFALSVEKDVAFGLENLGLPRDEIRKRVDWAMRVAGVYGLRDRAPHELSSGQQQRVAIASVLAMQPEVIVLDEPTSSLDPLGAKGIFEVIYELNRSLGVTVVVVEHRLDLIAKYVDHVILMNDGEVVLDGEPREVLSSKEARSIGVSIPKATRLYWTLRKSGLELGGAVPLSADEMVALIKGLCSK